MDLPLGPVPEWDMVVLGDANWNAGENQGGAVVGRDATFESFGIGTRLPLDRTRLDLAVGRALHFNNSGLNNGRATYGSGLSGPQDVTYFTKAAPPFDVGALFDALNIRSSFWATEVPPNGTIGPHDAARRGCSSPARIRSATSSRSRRTGSPRSPRSGSRCHPAPRR